MSTKAKRDILRQFIDRHKAPGTGSVRFDISGVSRVLGLLDELDECKAVIRELHHACKCSETLMPCPATSNRIYERAEKLLEGES